MFAARGVLPRSFRLGAYYRHADWLGSSRLSTTPGRVKYYDVAYAPFGEPYAGSGTQDLSFTGQNQDTASSVVPGGQGGIYDFLFRGQSPVQGRWLLPDPAGLAAVDPTDPQSWNRYAYVRNSPLDNIDPLGLCGDSPLPCFASGPKVPRPHLPYSGGGGGGAGMTCIWDGVESDCGMVMSALASGAAALCPQCQPGQIVGVDNRIYQWLASASQRLAPTDTVQQWAMAG
jgi:RHS repeat-associated protein